VKNYDVIVIGSGAGDLILESAMAHGLKCAMVDRGPLGGTCLNVGCIPSKLLIYPADVVADIRQSAKLGIEAEVKNVDFKAIMERMRRSIADEQTHMRQGLKGEQKFDLYEAEAHFVADNTLEVSGERIKGEKVFIASGSRPLIPRIKGLDTVPYLTNETLLSLREQPASIIIIGGGYIAVEYAHFFSSLGTRVTVIEMLDRLAANEEPDISALVTKRMSERMTVRLGMVAEEVKQDGARVVLVARDKLSSQLNEFAADSVLVAVGRRSNADTLSLDKTGVALDERGYVKVNEYLETTKKNIWAVGDANGKQMFTHAANHQATVAWNNTHAAKKVKVDFSFTPYAIFGHPQVASVGMKEAEAAKAHHILVGKVMYSEVAFGEAMMEEDGFAKAVADAETGRLLGFHIVGPHAAMLIQEVINCMAAGGDIDTIGAGIHIHPALPELVLRTLSALSELGHQHS